MYPSAPPVRTHDDPLTFHDLMAEQLRHAPWLVLSAAIHALVLLLLWVMMPAENSRKPTNKVEMQETTQPDVVVPPTPPPPVTEPEKTTDEVVIDEPTVTEPTDETSDTVAEVDAKPSAFDQNQWNAALGVGGGAGGPIGQRRRGGRGGHTNKEVPVAIENGLKWLERHQDADGKWDSDGFMKHDEGEPCDGPGNPVHDVGNTGLALLAFLGDGSTMRSGQFKEPIKKGVSWLKSQQQDNGLFGTNASHDFIYNHAIATYAMCEAFGLSNYQLLRPVAQKGVNYLEQHRNPYSVWRYQPRDNDNDTSVTGWCVMAYESGRFFGLEINKAALDICGVWLDQVSDATGKHGYSKVGEPSSRKPGDHATKFPVEKSEAMTAVGLFCRFFIGQKPAEKPVMKAAADLILSKPPIWDQKAGTIDEYYWYYATYALFQMGGRHWAEWQKKLTDAVVKPQHRDPAKQNLHGSWDPVGAWGEDGGRVYSTAILTLTLEAYYRYSKLVR